MKKVNDENTYLKKRLSQLTKDTEVANSKILLLEQINADFKMKEHMISRTFEEQIAELKEMLEKRETHMQSKEKKWLEIEEIMEEYAHDDEELREKFMEIRVNIKPDQKISNVVHENEQIQKECKNLQVKIKHLRDILISPDKKYDKIFDRQLKFDVKSKFRDFEDIQKSAIKPVFISEMAQRMEIVSDPIEKRKNFGMTMPVKLDMMQKDPLSYVNTIGLPIYSKESKKEL